jgi:CheY-like chemotaxis protein
VRLPLAEAPAAHSGPHAPHSNGAGLGRQRVLVVDDNVDAAVTLARMLEVIGHQAMVAHEGPEALAAAERFAPTLVLLDLGLPGMDGYAVARRLRALTTLPAFRLAALTGYGEDHDRRRSAEAGFDHHLVKPLSLAALQELIASLPRRPQEAMPRLN